MSNHRPNNTLLTRLLMLFSGFALGVAYQLLKVDMLGDYFWNIRLPLVLILGVLFFYAFHYVNARILKLILGVYDSRIQAEDMKSYLVLGLVFFFPLQEKAFQSIYPGPVFVYFLAAYALIVLIMKCLLVVSVKRKSTTPDPDAETGLAVSGRACVAAVVMIAPLFWFHQLTLAFDDFFGLFRYEKSASSYIRHANSTRKTFRYDRAIEFSTVLPSERSKAVVGFKLFNAPGKSSRSSIPIMFELRLTDDRGNPIAERSRALNAGAARSGGWHNFEIELPGAEGDPIHFAMTAKPQITRMGWRYLLDFLIHPPLDFPYFAKSSVRVGWSEPEIVQLDSKRPNVILISLDTLRADALGCYGNDGDGSPIIDAFAKENVRFENAFSQCSWTLPSHLSMFTSLFPPELASELDGFWFNTLQTKYGGKARSIHPTTLADILKKEGYYCAAFTGGGFVSAFYGFYKGFHIYNESNEASRISFLPAQAWIGKNAEKNFFVFVHTFAIHSTLIKPEWLKRFGSDSETLKKFLLDDTPKGHRNSYEYRVSVVDHYLGEFLSFLKDANLYEDTMIILTSDHGESFGEVHNDGKYVARGHGAVAYDEQIRVPLVIKLPGRLSKGPMVIEEDVRLLDIAPTILAALGLDPVLEFRGKSILPDFPSPENQMYSGVFSKAGGKTLSQSLRENGKKYILHHATGEEEFYDLTSDPGEERNLASQQTPEMLQLKKKYLELSERLGKREINLKKSATAAPPDIQEALKALGYLE